MGERRISPAAETVWPADPAAPEASEGRLKPGQIGPLGLAALAIGITSPAMGLYALWAPMQAAAGPITPLVFIAAMIVVLPTAVSYAELNQHEPSAGAAAAWLWTTINPAFGFLAGLVMMTYFMMVSISQPLLFSLFFRDFLVWLGLDVPGFWALAAGILVETGVVAWICLRGAEASIRTTVRLMIAETAVVLVLSATIIASRIADGSGLDLSPIDPRQAVDGLHGFWAAMILGVLAFCGFDVVSTAAEEAQAPRKFVPKAILLTVVGIALFWAANAFVLTLAAPHEKIIEYNSQGLTAITPIARNYWGAANLIVILTAFTGLTAVYISCVQGASRIIFALARHRLLPRPLAQLSGEKRIPKVAILTVIGACIAFDFASLAVAKDGLTGFVWWSNSLVFFALLTFAGVNIANLLYFRRHRPEAFHWFRNLLVPLAGLVANAYLIYAAFFSTLWTGPWATARSVVVVSVAILAAMIAIVLLVWLLGRGRLARGAPIGAEPR